MAEAPPNKTLARGLDVLELVLQADPPMRLKDVAECMQMDMASAHRVLRTLEVNGYLTRGEVERSYGPGQKIWSLLYYLPSTKEVIENLRPLLYELSAKTGQIAHIGVLEKSRVVLTDVALTPAARISVSQAAGDTEEVYCSAIGKVLAAFAPVGQSQALLGAQSFHRHTEFTIAGRTQLENELKSVRSVGIAFDDREGSVDISCIAAPILDPSGCCKMALGISSVASSFMGSIREREDWITFVKAAAAQASDRIQKEGGAM